MMHRKYIPATREEKRRIDAMMRLGCIVSRLRYEKGLAIPGGKVECHHIVAGRKRLGHWYTIPLAVYYHQAVIPYPYQSRAAARLVFGATLKDGRAFAEEHDTQLHLWQAVQRLLGLDDTLPATKMLPRRLTSASLASPSPRCDLGTDEQARRTPDLTHEECVKIGLGLLSGKP